jgi:hypothetical protein
VDTGFIARHRAELVPARGAVPDDTLALAALAVVRARADAALAAEPFSPWARAQGWRLNGDAHDDLVFKDGAREVTLRVHDRPGGYRSEAPDGAIGRLREAHERVLKDAERRITPDVIRRAQLTDWDLHDTIVDSLGNEIVSSAYKVNSIKIRLIRQAEVRLDPTRVESVMREHLGIVERMERRDVTGAQTALADHILDARTRAMGV